ncbi:MAG: DUF2269 family protein [Actinomycetota bacterium]
MNLYRILLFVHVTAVAIWVGGAVMFHVIAERAAASNDVGRISALLQDGEALGKRYFGPATMVTLLAGLWLVFEGDWGFDHLFIIGGLVGLVLTAIIGFGMIQPAASRTGAALAQAGAVTEEVRAGLARIRNISRADLLLLLVILFLMTTKPGL